MPADREIDIICACLSWLRLRGVYCWRQNQGAAMAIWRGRRRFFRFASVPGISDIIGLLRPTGQFLAIEVLRPGEQPKPEQQVFLDIVRANGGLALCVHSLDELQTALASAEGPGDFGPLEE